MIGAFNVMLLYLSVSGVCLYKALPQMLKTINRLDKLAALCRVFCRCGMLVGITSTYVAACLDGNAPPILPYAGTDEESEVLDSDEEEDIDPVTGGVTQSSIRLASKQGAFIHSLYLAMSDSLSSL